MYDTLMLPSSASTDCEALFRASSLDLLIPEASSFPPQPSHSASSTETRTWWAKTRANPARDVAFLDERLFYLVCLCLPHDALTHLAPTPGASGSEFDPPSEVLRFLSRLQLTLTASFLPPLPASETRRPPPILTSFDPPASASSLAPPSHPRGPRPPLTPNNASQPLVTPNPFPAMSEGEERYARVEGVTVWEGEVDEQGGPHGGPESTPPGRVILRTDRGWEVVWRGEAPIAYVRTQIQNPLLGLTASVTLRDQPRKIHRTVRSSLDNKSVHHVTETGTDDEDDEEEQGDIARMKEVDLLGGLSGTSDLMPSSRLAATVRYDLSLQESPLSPVAQSALASTTGPLATTRGGPSRHRAQPSQTIPTTAPSTLRKSYRRVLGLSPGLKVRMRTLLLPQLLPPQVADDSTPQRHDRDGQGERRVVLMVEIENPAEGLPSHSFVVEGVNVDVSGKGGKATARLICQPEQQSGVFPLNLRNVEQYNLLYAVTIAATSEDRRTSVNQAARSIGRGDEQRPVSIVIVGRPYEEGPETVFPTNTFHSRWNCTLDLGPYFASLSNSATYTPGPLSAPPRNHVSKPIIPPPNVIAGDKRYSLAALLSSDKQAESSRAHPQRSVSSTNQRPLLPSQTVNQPSNPRMASSRGLPPHLQNQRNGESQGLLISVKLLPQSPSGPDSFISGTIQPLEPFSIEVFVHNRTDEVRRFRLSIPSRDAWTSKAQDIWERRRQRKSEEPDWGVDDPILRQLLSRHLNQAPALVPLENDVRCGPLLPGAGMSARIRFVALREGVHKVEKLRVVGIDEEFDFAMSPVLDVVVGSGVDPT